MKFQIWIEPRAEKDLKKLPRIEYYRILSAFPVISNNPFIGKKMGGNYSRYYNYRVWPYRIVYQVTKQEKIVVITRIGHRQGIYK